MMFGEVRTAIETVELVISENVFHKWAELPHTQCSDEGIDNKRDLHQSFNLKVTPGQVTVSNACRTSKTIYLLPSNVQLVPSAYSTVDWVKGDGLHLRCKVSCSRSDVASVNGDIMANLGQIETDCNNVFLICKSCGQQLTRIIKRISPLPSDDWDGISEELWCCRSKDVAGVPPDLKMSPNREECLSGSFEYVLSIPQFLEQSVVFRDKDSARSGKKSHKIVKQVECTRCHGSIGNSLRVGKTDTISLWKFQTALITDDISLSSLNLCNSLEQLVSSYIYNQSRSHPTFKFMLENEDHDAQILLWLISPDSLLLRTGSDQAMGMGVGVASTVLNIHSASIMKLLYQTCWDEKGKSMKDEWSRDMMVHSFTLPTKACYQLSDILVQSTRNTPPSMRRMNGLLIGYLKNS